MSQIRLQHFEAGPGRPIGLVIALAVLGCALVAAGPSAAQAPQVQVDNTYGSSAPSATTTISWDHYITTGGDANADRGLLLVGVGILDQTKTVVSVVVDGTDIKSTQFGDGAGQTTTSPATALFKLVGKPAGGPYTITVTVSGSTIIAGVSTSFYNVNQVTPVGSPTGSGSATDKWNTANWVNVNGRYNNALCFAIAGIADNSSATDSAGQDHRIDVNTGSAFLLAAATKPQPVVTFTTISWSFSTDAFFATSGSEIRAYDIPTAVQMETFEAEPTRRGNAIRWRSADEVANLGFEVWREGLSGREKVTPQILGGSALLAGSTTRLTAGRRYEWVDASPEADASARYWIEEIALDGTRNWHGPVVSVEGSSRLRSDHEVAGDLARRTGFLASVGADEPTRAKESGFPAVEEAETAIESQAVTAVSGGARPMAPSSALRTQQDLAAGDALKISVASEGWYRLTRSALVAAGFDPGRSPSRSLQLFTQGVEQPMFVSDGGRSGDFTLEFYGVPQDTAWTGTRVYWLVDGDDASRVSTASASPKQAAGSTSFPYVVERRDRSVYFAALTNNGDEANLFGAIVSSTGVDQTLTVTGLGAATDATYPLTVSLQGVTTVQQHTVRVRFNGHDLGVTSSRNRDRSVKTFAIPAAWISAGINTVQLQAEAPGTDVSLVDYLRLTYPRSYAVQDGVLKFTAKRGTTVSISGFTSSAARVFDVTNPLAISQLPASFSKAAAGGYTATVNVAGSGQSQRILLAVSDDRVLAPASLAANVRSTLHDGILKANYWVIAHGSLVRSVASLVKQRSGQGLRTAVVDVADIYDEYSFGEKSPYAIRDFLLSRVKGSDAAPYVLLVGSASYDPRNFLGMGQKDLVPTKLVPIGGMKTAYDGWFMDTGTQALPVGMIGRLAVSTPTETAAQVSKILAWESGISTGTIWRRPLLLVSGPNDSPTASNFQFEAGIDDLAARIPSPKTATVLKLGQPGTSRAQLLSALNAGPPLVTYMGHGSQDTWVSTGTFNGADATALANAGKPSIFLAFTCFNGFFVDVYIDSLGARLQDNSTGGAVATVASSGVVEPEGQGQMANAFYDAVFVGKATRLGDALRTGRAATRDLVVRQSFNLLGDPALKLR